MSGSALPVTARDPQERKKLNHDSGDEPSENVDRSADPQRVGLTVRKTRLDGHPPFGGGHNAGRTTVGTAEPVALQRPCAQQSPWHCVACDGTQGATNRTSIVIPEVPFGMFRPSGRHGLLFACYVRPAHPTSPLVIGRLAIDPTTAPIDAEHVLGYVVV